MEDQPERTYVDYLLMAEQCEEEGPPKVRRVRVAHVVPKRRIASEAELEEALEALRKAVARARHDAEAVELE